MPDVSNLHASDKILTLSNSISFFRIILAIPTVIFFLQRNYPLTASLMAFAYITDLLDGYIARKTNTISEFGKAIDPVADKLYVAALVLAMVSRQMVPFWFVLVVIGKDILIMIGVLIARKKIGAVLPSNYWGKAAVLLTIICLFLAVCGVSHDVLVFGWIASTALIAISFFIYAYRALKLLKSSAIAKS
ncbi:MAG: CDP-alcohol phosphatidyltransferase family protein [Candidatus Kapaibacterium sp.]